MIRQRLLLNNKQPTAQIYDFMEFQRNKPIFHEPIKINIGHPINEAYFMVKNIVYKEKQILVLKQEMDSMTMVLVEAKLKDGKLHSLLKLSNKNICDISRMLEGNT